MKKPEPADIVVESPGGRLDSYLADQLLDRSRTWIQSMIRKARVRVNGVVVIKPAFEVQPGDAIQLIESEAEQAPVGDHELIELEILHETEDYLVFNKPPGIVVHPSLGHETGTLAQAALAHAPALLGVGEPGREGLVHRLDKDTSGLIIFAKNEASLARLQQQFKSRLIEKTYIALVDGHPPSDTGRVEAPIARDPKHRQRFAVVEGGRTAVSEFDIRERYQHHSLVEVHPITGRTHQIRIHMQFLKCPVVGDTVYGKRHPSLDVGRQMLHAWKMKVPGEGEFEAPMPDDMLDGIEQAARK